MADLLNEITFCDECPYSGEPNGCNREEGVCKAHESYFDLVKENATLHERLEKSVELPCKIGDKVYAIFSIGDELKILGGTFVGIEEVVSDFKACMCAIMLDKRKTGITSILIGF